MANTVGCWLTDMRGYAVSPTVVHSPNDSGHADDDGHAAG